MLLTPKPALGWNQPTTNLDNLKINCCRVRFEEQRGLGFLGHLQHVVNIMVGVGDTTPTTLP